MNKPGRGKGRRIDRNGRSKLDEQFVPIPYPMAESEAFRSLSGNALKVYVELRRRYNGANNGRLFLAFGEAAKLLGIGKSTAQRAFEELEQKGFVKQTRRGSWYGRQANEWAVSDQRHNGDRPTNAWRDWRPPKPKNRTRSPHGPIGLVDGPTSEP